MKFPFVLLYSILILIYTIITFLIDVSANRFRALEDADRRPNRPSAFNILLNQIAVWWRMAFRATCHHEQASYLHSRRALVARLSRARHAQVVLSGRTTLARCFPTLAWFSQMFRGIIKRGHTHCNTLSGSHGEATEDDDLIVDVLVGVCLCRAIGAFRRGDNEWRATYMLFAAASLSFLQRVSVVVQTFALLAFYAYGVGLRPSTILFACAFIQVVVALLLFDIFIEGYVTVIAPKLLGEVCGRLYGYLASILTNFAQGFTSSTTLSGSHGEWTNGDDFDHDKHIECANRTRARREARNHTHKRARTEPFENNVNIAPALRGPIQAQPAPRNPVRDRVPAPYATREVHGAANVPRAVPTARPHLPLVRPVHEASGVRPPAGMPSIDETAAVGEYVEGRVFAYHFHGNFGYFATHTILLVLYYLVIMLNSMARAFPATVPYGALVQAYFRAFVQRVMTQRSATLFHFSHEGGLQWSPIFPMPSNALSAEYVEDTAWHRGYSSVSVVPVPMWLVLELCQKFGAPKPNKHLFQNCVFALRGAGHATVADFERDVVTASYYFINYCARVAHYKETLKPDDGSVLRL